MSLHVDHYPYQGAGSSGTPLLLIHGWGMHGGMWKNVTERLSAHRDVYVVDLPGHGYSKALRPSQASGMGLLDALVDPVAAQFDGPLILCGWSLGGQVSLRWALRHPQQVERLILVASTPCFVRQQDWRYALSMEIVEDFAENLRQNYAQTLKRFLSLQMRGSELERETLALLRDALFSRGEPDITALQNGLDIQRECDLRSSLAQVTQSVLVLPGEHDTLIPPQAGRYLAEHIPRARLVEIKGAAHAPFLSHPEIFVDAVMGFMRDGN